MSSDSVAEALSYDAGRCNLLFLQCHVVAFASGMASAELLRAGYPFVLNRCQDASFISVTNVAESARTALRQKLESESELKYLRQLRITDSPNKKEYIAPYICSRCPNLQVGWGSHQSTCLPPACVIGKWREVIMRLGMGLTVKCTCQPSTHKGSTHGMSCLAESADLGEHRYSTEGSPGLCRR